MPDGIQIYKASSNGNGQHEQGLVVRGFELFDTTTTELLPSPPDTPINFDLCGVSNYIEQPGDRPFF